MNVGQLRRALEGLPDHLPVKVGEGLEESRVVELRAGQKMSGVVRYVFVGYDPSEVDDGTETEKVEADTEVEDELAGGPQDLGEALDDLGEDGEPLAEDEDE